MYTPEWSDLANTMFILAESCKVSPDEVKEANRVINSAFPNVEEATKGLKLAARLLDKDDD